MTLLYRLSSNVEDDQQKPENEVDADEHDGVTDESLFQAVLINVKLDLVVQFAAFLADVEDHKVAQPHEDGEHADVDQKLIHRQDAKGGEHEPHEGGDKDQRLKQFFYEFHGITPREKQWEQRPVAAAPMRYLLDYTSSSTMSSPAST